MKIFNSVKGNRGYTVIEMVVVLSIILAFLALGMPYFSNFGRSLNLKATEREVGTVLRTARSYAISRNEGYSVFFDTSVTPNIFYIYRTADTNKSPVDKTGLASSGVTFNANTTITFAANGGLAGGSATSITINMGTSSKQITVSNVTGAVTMP